jgi:hypothetical protein
LKPILAKVRAAPGSDFSPRATTITAERSVWGQPLERHRLRQGVS